MAKRIMIVDDAAVMRMMLKNMLQSIGYEVIAEATNGKEAVVKYQECRPDLVTMDITMPEMDGIQAVRSIRILDPKAKIVMCSAMGQKALVLEAIEAGACNFIVKPFNEGKVREVIGKLLDN
ncbi:MAG TPA: response regulator [Bacillota bacterium]|nr:response regulator [Bacillota bacterium]HPT86578.1 response regulator [Bacillota bacterium]